MNASKCFHIMCVVAAGMLLEAGCASSNLSPDTISLITHQAVEDSEPVLVRQVSARVVAVDGIAIPPHPDAEKYYYRDIRLSPGPHSVDLHNIWGASVMVSPSGYVDGGRSFDAVLEAGHVYEVHSDRTHGNVRMYFWIEDTSTGEVVAGTRMGGPQNIEPTELQWSLDEKRIYFFVPQFNLMELVVGAEYVPRTDWNEVGQRLATEYITDELKEIGILTIANRSNDLDTECEPDTNSGLELYCAENLRNSVHADYGLFLDVRDWYSSRGMVAGRAALTAILFPAAPLLIASMVMDEEDARPAACLSLIDMHSGRVAWRNCLDRAGKWMDEDTARQNAQDLLSVFPAS